MDRIERREFVRKHRTCIFGYNRTNDGPAMTVVYYVLDGDDLLISSMAARGKAQAVQRNPKVSLCILDEQWPLTYLQVYGDATLEEDFDQAVDVLRRVIDLMAGEDVSSAKLPEIERMAREENRVVIRVRPYATFATPRLQGRGHRHADALHQQQPALVTSGSWPTSAPVAEARNM
jgi:PPOX class probable F420-dependent enzyme